MNETRPNPLLAPLLTLLRQASGSYKVHELLAELRRQRPSRLCRGMSSCSCFASTFSS